MGGFISDDPNTAGRLIYREWTPNVRVLFNNGAEINSSLHDVVYQFLDQPLHLYKDISIPAGSYEFTSRTLAYTSAGNRRFTYSLSEQWGGFYTGTLNTAMVTAQYRPNPHLALAVNNTLNSFRLPEGDFDIDLAGVQVSYAFNRFLNATTFVQADTAQTQAISANFRVRYTFRPDSDLYFVYNLGSRFQSLAAGNPMQLRQQKFAVKITYSWSR